MAIATMQMVLSSVLDQANKEQNMAYPPHVFSGHFNLVTSFLVDEVAKLFPTSQAMIDIIRPFLEKELLPVKNGVISFPENYRHLLTAAIFVSTDYKDNCIPEAEKPEGECEFPNDPLAPTAGQIAQRTERRRCVSKGVRIVDIDEWDNLTSHPYKYPTLKDPIGCIFQGEGIKICPFDVPNVELRYIKQPKRYQYGYVMNPDDTYSWDKNSTQESEWTDNALVPLFKGVTTLYSNYVQDGELRDGMLQLKKAGIF